MTDDEIRAHLKPKSHLTAILGTALGVGAAAWAASEWLHSRAGADDVKAITNNSFLQRLDMETMKGEMKAFNIRLERIEKNTDTAKTENDNRRRR